MSRQIPSLRVFVEGVVIVGSILLAFGIEALWDGRQERAEERAILSGLHQDFLGNRERLDAVVEGHSASLQRFNHFRALSSDVLAGLPQDSLNAFLGTLYGSRTFDPFQGTLEATLSAGKLGILRDIDLRDALGEWIRASADLLENGSELRAEAQRVRYAIEAYGGPFQGTGPPRTSVLPEIDGPTLARIQVDDSVMGRARTKLFSLEIYLVELIQLQTILDSVLTLVEESLD